MVTPKTEILFLMSDFIHKKSPCNFAWTIEFIMSTADLKSMVTAKFSKKAQSNQGKELPILCKPCVNLCDLCG
jgi:hypothetical protein